MEWVADNFHSFITNVNSPPKGFENVALETWLVALRTYGISEHNIHCTTESPPLPLEGTKLMGLESLLCSEQTTCHKHRSGYVEREVDGPAIL